MNQLILRGRYGWNVLFCISTQTVIMLIGSALYWTGVRWRCAETNMTTHCPGICRLLPLRLQRYFPGISAVTILLLNCVLIQNYSCYTQRVSNGKQYLSGLILYAHNRDYKGCFKIEQISSSTDQLLLLLPFCFILFLWRTSYLSAHCLC
jgi:hypothetical protein